ncbi:MAG: endolytic transglycosylase MltG, partial [Coriobacteriia bacterium]
LSEAGVIENANMFRLQVRLDGTGGQLKSGVYELSTGMGYEVVTEVLIEGPVYTYFTVTVPEGFVVEQIAERFEAQAGVPAAEFLELAKGGAAQFSGEHPYLADVYQGSLEGYLFPKTYRVREGSSASEVIGMMLEQFDREIADVDFSYPESRGMSLHSTIVLASMIEREVRVPKEQELVSSVIYNRLDKGMRLEIDATIEYVLPGNRFRLRSSDIQIDSPYNTYRNKGLPPGAIANPGKAAIQAACAPAKTTYLYYVLTAKDGSHTFATTHEQFLVAKRKSKEVFGQ